MEVSELIPLARLPKSPQGSERVTFGPVVGCRNGVKRRRHEICASIDGNCVNIYEVGT